MKKEISAALSEFRQLKKGETHTIKFKHQSRDKNKSAKIHVIRSAGGSVHLKLSNVVGYQPGAIESRANFYLAQIVLPDPKSKDVIWIEVRQGDSYQIGIDYRLGSDTRYFALNTSAPVCDGRVLGKSWMGNYLGILPAICRPGAGRDYHRFKLA
jgi:hypothetical protein